MGERQTGEIIVAEEQAADFLRRSLISHVHTGPIITRLRATDPGFQEMFTLAQTPIAVLEAVSASGSEIGIKVVEGFVDRWVHTGNNKNPTTTRRLIDSAHRQWVASLERED